ncbi:MAG: hypothetical protein AAF846_11185 [Chloroflexota bacterium]
MTRFTEIMHNISGALMLIGQTVFSAFGTIVILALVLYVEIQRVAHGAMLFETSSDLAYLGAFVLVMMLLTLEFVTHYIEAKHDYHEPRRTHISLRLLGRWLVYFIGCGKHWQERKKSPAHSIKTYSRLLTFTILSLALAGSMTETLASVEGNWMQGLQAIVLQSTLLELAEWVSGFFFALALVVGSQRLTAYVAQRASETYLESKNQHIPAKLESAISIWDEPQPDDEDTEPMPVPDDNLLASDYFTVECECGWSREYETEDSARRGLNAHQQRCDVYQASAS